jgi:hypothetical protein
MPDATEPPPWLVLPESFGTKITFVQPKLTQVLVGAATLASNVPSTARRARTARHAHPGRDPRSILRVSRQPL